MFLFKNIKPLNHSSYNFPKHFKKTLSVISHLSTDSSLIEKDYTETSLKDKILFNSCIHSKQVRPNFKTKKLLSQRKRIIERIQPLPLSLRFLSETATNHSPEEKLNPSNVQTNENQKEIQFPYNSNYTNIFEEKHSSNESLEINDGTVDGIEKEIRRRKENLKKWMNAYDNLEYDITEEGEDDVINYGTPDPKSKISNVPCGGCGAFLHCKDTAIPGYIPSEIFKNTGKLGGESLEAIICQRCFFLKEHDIALQVRVSPDDYPKVLKSIQNKKALVLLMVDLTDFPCSIWPGIADILGPKTPILVVGNKIDLIPKDSKEFLSNIRQKLYEHTKISGFGTANILDVVLISAKTGYGVEDLVTSLQKLWQVKDVYLVGCTNVGKSSLFNALLQSDYCKFQASDLIHRATTSQWPGTTLNLLKFPIMRASHHRVYMRIHRLIETNKRLAAEEERRQEMLKTHNTPANATLIGRIERTISMDPETPEKADSFTTQVNLKATGVKIGLRENHPDFSSGRWCYDTPGVVHPNQILDLLTLDELILTLPKELIRPETFRLWPGTSLFIAGLARLDYLDGPEPIRLTVFRSNELPITICNIEDADKIYQYSLGTDLFKVPMDENDRLKNWPGLEAGKQFVIKGIDKRLSSKDIVLSNAGWVAVNCSPDEYSFRAWTPEKRGIHLRDCILPKAVTLRGKLIRHSLAYQKHQFI